MADTQTRSDYLKIMMGNRNEALAPYRPEQMNDLGDTSFDVASLSNDDINATLASINAPKASSNGLVSTIPSENQQSEEKRNKPWYEQIGDFFFNIGTSITEGVLNVVDSVWDFGVGVAGGLFGGGWFGAKNDFTDWAANVMTDDRWIQSATKALTFANPLEMATNIGNQNYWNDFWNFTPESVEQQYAENYEGMDWLHKGGNFIGEIIPSLVLAYFTGGASLGAQAAAQGGLAFAKGMGEAQSRALQEGASFQSSAGYGAVKGAISGALSAGMTYAGGTFASRGADSLISKAGNKVGDAVFTKLGSKNLAFAAKSATEFVIRVAGDAGESAVLTAIEPAFQQIYNDQAWYNAYGTDENRKAYAEQIGKAALTGAAFSALTNAFRDALAIHKQGGLQKAISNYEEGALRRISENQVLNGLSKADRKLARQGAEEWNDIQKEINRSQSEYETLKARGASDADIELYVGKQREALQQRVEAYSAKYGKLFTKLTSKAHPDVVSAEDVGKISAEQLSKVQSDTFQKLQSMTSKGLKNQLSTLFNGKNGISGLITYTEGSKPIETVKENDEIVAKPKDFEDVQSVLAAVTSNVENAPSVIVLPIKGGDVRLTMSVIEPRQAEKLSFLKPGDLEVISENKKVASLGDGKSLVIDESSKTAEIVSTQDVLQPTAVEAKPNDTVAEVPAVEPFKPVQTNAEPSIVKQAANAKEGKVYKISSVESMVNGITDSIHSLLDLDNLGGDTKLNLPKAKTVTDLFNTLNLGTDEQKAQLKEYFKGELLKMNIDYNLKDFYGESLDSYSGSWSDFIATMDKEQLDKFNADFDKFYRDLIKSGSESEMSKVIRTYSERIQKAVDAYKELKAQTKLHGHIQDHKTKLLKRYYNGVDDFGPDFDFDTQGFKVLLEPLKGLEQTPGKQSYTGKSAYDSFKQFLENYTLDHFSKKNDDGDVISVSSLYNQGLRDLATYLVQSIESNAVTDKNGKLTYKALNSTELSVLRAFQDEVEKMPKRVTKDTIQAVSDAKAAYTGVERYISNITKNGEVGVVRKFIQGYSERYSNQLDALRYEAGDNVLTEAFYNDLYLSHAQALGMEDDFRAKIKASRESTGVTNKKWDADSSFKDTSGKPIEMKYLVRIYQHLCAGEESNNVKYINANTVYIRDAKNKLIHVAKLDYSDLKAIESELEAAGLLEHAKNLHQIESKDLGKIYDEDYLRDTHLQNSNRLKEYTGISLESNKSELGKAYIKAGVAQYGHQKNRVDNIPKGVHLVIRDPEIQVMSEVSNQANIHFNDPVLKKINRMLNTRLDDSGSTVREYLTQHNPGALKLIERAVNGAYGVPSNKTSKLIDFAGNGYVMTLIGLNPGSILRQPLSIMWSNDISIGTVLRFTIGANLNPRIWKNSTRLLAEIEEEFPELRLRGKQNEALMGNVAADKINKVQNAIGKVAGAGLKLTDRWTVGHEAVGLLSLQAQQLGYGDVGTYENDKYVKAHYRAFYATQVSSNRITMSGARAGYYGGLGKFTSFMTGAIQGQAGHLLRAAQQIREYKGKTQEYYDNLIEKTREAENDARREYEESVEHLEDVKDWYRQGTATKEELKEAKENVKNNFNKYTKAAGERADAETSAKGFKHFKDMGGTKGVIIGRLASALITGLLMVAINELTARLKGQKAWNEFDAGEAGKDLAINTLGGWMPIVRDLVSAWKGYDLDIPEYAMIRQAYDLISAIADAAKNPSDKAARSLLKKAIDSISAFFGIPTANLWKYANGIIKTFSPSTAIKMNNLLYGASYTSLASNAKQYAEKNDISTAADLYETIYASYKTDSIDRDTAVEEAKLIREGFNPIAKNVPDYIVGEDGERVYISEDQKSNFAKVYERANKQVTKLIKSAKYKSMDSETKAKSIKKVYDVYYEAARYKSLGVEPDSKLGKLLAYSTDIDDSLLATLMLIQQNAALVDNKRFTKKEQAIRIVNQQPMSKKQKLLTLYLMGYGVNAENKKMLQNYLISLGFSKKQAEDFLPLSK